MIKIAVELSNGANAYLFYGHTFDSVESAKTYLARNGGGTIEIVPGESSVALYDESFQPTPLDVPFEKYELVIVNAESPIEYRALACKLWAIILKTTDQNTYFDALELLNDLQIAASPEFPIGE